MQSSLSRTSKVVLIILLSIVCDWIAIPNYQAFLWALVVPTHNRFGRQPFGSSSSRQRNEWRYSLSPSFQSFIIHHAETWLNLTPVTRRGFIPVLHMTSFSSQERPEIDSMKASDLRKELESYGISTKSFFEKSELADAVKKARSEGKTSSSSTTTATTTKSSATSTSTSTTDKKTREQRLEEEMANCQRLKIGELKKELEMLSISTTTFFEKSEFVRALAEARVDGVQKKTSGSSSGQTKSTSSRRKAEEAYDPTYRDVIMQKMPRDTRIGSVIDVRLGTK